MISRLAMPYASMSGKASSPDTAVSTSAVVNMPDPNGRTLVRQYIVPNQPNSAPQLLSTSRFATVSEAYQTCSVAEVEGWQALAASIVRTGRLGLDYKLNWTQLFQSVNNYRLQHGSALTTSPPASIATAPTPTAITAVASSDDVGSQDVILTITEAAAPGTTSWLAIRMTRDLGSPVRQARPTDYRYIATPTLSILARDNSSPYTYTIVTSTLNVYIGEYVGVEITVLNSDFIPVARIRNNNIPVVGAP